MDTFIIFLQNQCHSLTRTVTIGISGRKT